METILYSDDNTDIREFFRHDQPRHVATSGAPANGYVQPGTDHPHSVDAPFKSPSAVSKRIGNAAENILERGRGTGKQQRPSSQPSDTGHRSAEIHHGSSTSRLHQPETYKDRSHASKLLRPCSMDIDLGSDQSAAMRMPVEKEHNNDSRQSNRDMAAFFKSYQDREEAFVDQSSSPIRRQELQLAPVQRSQPPRCRTTEGLQRTKSSKLPLEHVPQGYNLQNIVLCLDTSIVAIIQSAGHMDMRNNSLTWPHSATCNAYNIFVEPIAATQVMNWVVELDAKLGEQFEPLPGVEVRPLIHEAIQRGIDEKRSKTVMDRMGRIVASDAAGDHRKDADPASEGVGNIAHSYLFKKAKAGDEAWEFDTSEFLDSDAAFSDECERGRPRVRVCVKEREEDCGDAIDDDMLLDI